MSFAQGYADVNSRFRELDEQNVQDALRSRGRMDQMRQAEIARQTYTPQGGDIPMDAGQPVQAQGGGAASPMAQQARFNQLKTQQPAYANQSEAETRRLTRNPQVPQVADVGSLRLRTPGSWAPLPMNEQQRLAEMRSLNPVEPQANQTRTEDSRLSRQAPVGVTSGGAPAGDFIARIRQAESNGNVNAVGPYVPGQGTAKGDMQVMDKTFSDPGFGVRPAQNNSPEERSRIGRDYAQALLQRYGNEQEAAAAYNWGPGNYDRWKAAGANPAQMPAETRNYVAKVTGGAAPQQSAQAPQGQPQQASQVAANYFSPQGQGMDQFRAQQLQQAMQFERDPAKINAMQAQLQEFQLRDFAGRAAQGDVQSISQLASAAGAALVRTPRGFAFVNPNTKEYLSQEMPASQVAAVLYQQVSAAHRAAAAASSAKIQEEQAKQMAQGDRELRVAGGTSSELEALKSLQRMLEERSKPQGYQGIVDPMKGGVTIFNKGTGQVLPPQMADNAVALPS